MLTFLRKIRKSLLDTGEARRYILYAIGEIALVVIGILIALQVNNWNEWRKERVIEVKALKEIEENLEANIFRVQEMKKRCEIDNQSADIIIALIHNNTEYTDSLNLHFYFALNPVDEGSFLSSVGYESLKNVGFEIIRNYELKKAIINLFEESYRELRAKYDRIGQMSSSELIKYRKQYFLFKPDTVRQSIGLYPKDLDDIIRNQELESQLNETRGIRRWVTLSLDQSLADTKHVLQMIKEELGEKI